MHLNRDMMLNSLRNSEIRILFSQQELMLRKVMYKPWKFCLLTMVPTCFLIALQFCPTFQRPLLHMNILFCCPKLVLTVTP
uniref:Alternative protein NBAS n=1 Tax=Homo sapiens TaxID=9606 RepID=L8E9V8_HUMAN|nr:alternative protein NBAS [Homo sapiens]